MRSGNQQWRFWQVLLPLRYSRHWAHRYRSDWIALVMEPRHYHPHLHWLVQSEDF